MSDRQPASDGDLDDIYREIILDHYRRPRNRGLLDHPDISAEGVNPVCGDQIRLSLKLAGEQITATGFKGSGCAISQSSASLMTEAIKLHDLSSAERMRHEFESMMTDGAEPAEELGDLAALQGVAKFHARVKCALLPWKVLAEAIKERDGSPVTVTTES